MDYIEIGLCPVCNHTLQSCGIADIATKTVKPPQAPTNEVTICPKCLHVLCFRWGQWEMMFAGNYLDLKIEMIIQLNELRSQLKARRAKLSKEGEGDQSLSV